MNEATSSLTRAGDEWVLECNLRIKPYQIGISFGHSLQQLSDHRTQFF